MRSTTRLRARTGALVMTLLLLGPFAACGGTDAAGDDGGVTPISPEAWLSSPPRDALLLDVRSREEFAKGHVPGAVNIPHDELAGRLGELPGGKDRALVVYCESGRRAGRAESLLAEQGYSNLHHLEGDMKAWRAAGRPTER